MGLQRVGHNWATNTHTHTHTNPEVSVIWTCSLYLGCFLVLYYLDYSWSEDLNHIFTRLFTSIQLLMCFNIELNENVQETLSWYEEHQTTWTNIFSPNWEEFSEVKDQPSQSNPSINNDFSAFLLNLHLTQKTTSFPHVRLIPLS